MEKKAPEVLVIDLVDRRPSNYVLEGSEIGGQPKQLDCPADKNIKPTSVVRVPNLKGGGYTLRKTRYIQGCDTIFVDEQEARRVTPNPAIDRADLVIKNGSKIIVRTGGAISLFDYFKNYEGNESNPNRPEGATIIYREINAAVDAEASISGFDDDVEARMYLRDLKDKDDKGKVTYKEKEINFLIGLFGMPHMESMAEKFEALIGIATSNPRVFLDSIANAKAAMTSEVNQGKAMGVVTFDASKAMLTSASKVLFTFKTTKYEDQINELVTFFLTTAGDQAYKQFSLDLRHAKERALSVEK